MVRYTGRRHLNDPFELQARWDMMMGSRFADLVIAPLRKGLNEVISNDQFILEEIAREARQRGEFHTSQTIRQRLGTAKIRDARKIVSREIERLITVLGNLRVEDPVTRVGIERILDNTGVFSVTCDPKNTVMWAHYAQLGKGFVAEIEVTASFFRTEDGKRSRFIQVDYNSPPNVEFLERPLLSFVSKGLHWSYEQEYRDIRPLDTADSIITVESQDVHLFRIPEGTLKRVILGYASDPKVSDLVERLNRSRSSPVEVSKARLNPSTRTIEISPL
jgi:hypothetical protein